MEKYTQLEFQEIMDTSKNWFAIPKKNGIKNEISYNYRQLEKISRQSITKSLQLCKRQVQLYKELQKS